MYLINRLFNPEIFQGKHRHKNYFEGWYFKAIDADAENICAIIPGVSLTSKDKHAFIQFIDAVSGKTGYFRYPIQDFNYSAKSFDIYIGGNHFNKNGFSVDFGSDDFRVAGEIRYTNIVPFPKTVLNPGIMGPYTFIPFMECYHGIVNIHCGVSGLLDINGNKIDFTGGYGYLEKDWGTSFPKSWIWLQSNHFEGGNASVMFSVAAIPWLGSEFDGLIAFLRIGDSFYRFATYTKAGIKKLAYEGNMLEIVVEDREYSLLIQASVKTGGVLKAPKNGMMNIDITESITSLVEVNLSHKNGNVIFKGTGRNTGLELAGEYRRFET
jgi:tocopherol cyclase